MSEMYVNVYFQHEDPDIHSQLVQLFESGDASEDESARQSFIDAAVAINPEKGEGIAKAFVRDLDEKIREMFDFEEIEDISGFCCAGGTHGGGGDRFAARCVKFLYHLCPGINALAWGMGDDDPWEFWFKHEGGRLVRHDAEPYDGNDNYLRSTIYRWWHDGLPKEIQEGMLNDSDEDDEDDESEAVSEEQYQQWLSGHAEGSDLEDDIEEVVMDEFVGAFTNALAGLFGDKSTKSTVSPDAFDADSLNEEIVRQVLVDMEACAKAFDIDGVMKHLSRSFKGTMTTTIEGKECAVPLTHGLYRMSLKLVLKEDAEYESEQVINDLEIVENQATVSTNSAAKFIDPSTNIKMHTTTADKYILEIVDGKVQVTGLESKELASNAA